jgi:sec-independent protein translocase protein TatB
MFGLSVERLFLLGLVGMFVLGPERLPAAATWVGRTLRQVKSYATGANQQLRRELGPELDQLREPLAQLRQPLDELRGPLQTLRGVRDPRTALSRYLLSDSDPTSAAATSARGGTDTTLGTDPGVKPVSAWRQQPSAGRPLIDPDAT